MKLEILNRTRILSKSVCIYSSIHLHPSTALFERREVNKEEPGKQEQTVQTVQT
jgi:hypothetical protein